MDEQDFRTALRATVTATSQPPPMAATPVLDAARRDRKRRHAMWAGVGSAAAVVAIAVGVVIVAPSTPGDGLGVGGTSPTVQPTENTRKTENTETAWPNGQTDQVADSGPEYDKAVALVAKLGAVVPAGYESPDDLVGEGELDGVRLKRHQAQYENGPDETKVWSYYADAPVTQGGRVGRLSVEVHAPAPGLSHPDGCDLGPADACTEVMVGDKPVAVFSTGEDGQVGQAAGYRHEDGTLVYVRQASHFAYAGKPSLPALPFTSQQLAELATDPRLHIN